MFIEDFYKLQELNEDERRVLSRDVSCDYLPTIQEYKKQLTNSGFIDIKMIDKTESWINFVNERMKDFSQHRSNHVDKHDLDVVDGLEDFYKKMAGLYNGGNLGGLRIIAKNW